VPFYHGRTLYVFRSCCKRGLFPQKSPNSLYQTSKIVRSGIRRLSSLPCHRTLYISNSFYQRGFFLQEAQKSPVHIRLFPQKRTLSATDIKKPCILYVGLFPRKEGCLGKRALNDVSLGFPPPKEGSLRRRTLNI